VLWTAEEIMATDEKTRTELEAAVYRRLVEHLRSRTDVQNIDLMNLAGFCRNCLSNWMKDAADAKGTPMTKEEALMLGDLRRALCSAVDETARRLTKVRRLSKPLN
jgi:phage terminase small subunit